MIDFELSDEERLIRETAARFAAERLQPGLRAHERTRGVPDAIIQEFATLGLAAVDLPTAHGGQGLGAFVRALVLEELAAVDPGAALAVDGIGLARYPLLEAGLLGTVDAGVRGVVVEDGEGRFQVDGGRVRGEHPWVPADRPAVVVVAQEDRALVVTDGIEATPIKSCGLEAAGAAQLTLHGAPIAATIPGTAALSRARARMRAAVAALLTGAARGAHAYAARYATERVAFGRPIAHHQALAFLLVDMATAVDAARLAAWHAAAAIDAGRDAAWEAAAALAEAAEQALFVGPNAVQILGGHGFMKDHPVEKWMRDIRTLAQLAGGRDEADLVAAALAPGRDLGLA